MTALLAKIETLQTLLRDPAVDPMTKHIVALRLRQLLAKALGL
jgi:hypothetical protein